MEQEQPIKHIHMRFPGDLLVELKPLAQTDARSLQSEILWILRNYVAQRKQEQHAPSQDLQV